MTVVNGNPLYMVIKDLVLDILFPRICVGCGKEGTYICDKCKVFVSEAEPIIYTGECLDGLISVWDYEGLIKELIQMIKYQGVTDIIKELMSLIDIKIYYPYITYVPMHIKRKKRRGFNQSELIAKELSKKSKARLDSARHARTLSLLEKVVDTKDQAKLSKEERLENVKDSFKFWDRLGLSQVSQVLLVDDVFTTGATMRECCKVLKQAGIKKVLGFTLARTP